MIIFSSGTSPNRLHTLRLLTRYKVLNSRLKMILMPTYKQIWRILINQPMSKTRIIKAPYSQAAKKIPNRMIKQFPKMHPSQRKPFTKMNKMAMTTMFTQTLACNNKIIVKLHSLNHSHNHNRFLVHKSILPSPQSIFSQFGPSLV